MFYTKNHKKSLNENLKQIKTRKSYKNAKYCTRMKKNTRMPNTFLAFFYPPSTCANSQTMRVLKINQSYGVTFLHSLVLSYCYFSYFFVFMKQNFTALQEQQSEFQN